MLLVRLLACPMASISVVMQAGYACSALEMVAKAAATCGTLQEK